MHKLIILFFCLIFGFGLSAQIRLDNASFEGELEDATLPNGWLQCKDGTTPDILPGAWGVYNEPSDGESYMGLITRSDKTWESVGQRLPQSLAAESCYSLV